jgi:hypothetical protein
MIAPDHARQPTAPARGRDRARELAAQPAYRKCFATLACGRFEDRAHARRDPARLEPR